MALSNELISQFAKLVKDDKPAKKETTVYGTVVIDSGVKYVKIDGSDRLTPISMTADVKDNERVTVMIKNHTAIVNGNISSPAARTGDVQEVGNKITEVEILVADKVDTKQLNAQVARIDNLIAENATITNKLTAAEADIDNLEANNATITGKLTAAEADIDNLEVNKLSASVAEAKYATIENLDATNADIHNLNADYGAFKSLTTDKLTANEASINDLTTSNATITNKLTAAEADIDNLTAENATITGKLTASEADIDNLKTSNATITGKLTAAEADIDNLEATKLSAESADLKYANIDFTNIGKAAIESFFSKSGMISDLVVGDTSVTGKLVGVTIIGDLIEGGTVKADKLVVLGSDGLYYKLNTDGVSTSAEQTEYNSLNGSVITAKSITAEKVRVDDLVAFGATIGGFHITDNSIYSGVKESATNTTRGIYMDTDGQIAFGNTNRFVKFYKDQDGAYKLAVSADDISFGADNKNIKTAIEDIESRMTSAETSITQNKNQISLRATKTEVTTAITNLEIGGRNYILNSANIIVDRLNATGSYAEYAKVNVGQSYMNIKANTPLIFSFDLEMHAGTANPTFQIYNTNVACPKRLVGGSLTFEAAVGDVIKKRCSISTYLIDRTEPTETDNYIEFFSTYKTGNVFKVTNMKLEMGDKATDWTPAPEDAESLIEDVDTRTTDSINDVQTKVEANTAAIDILIDKISMLVVGENGSTLYEQTDDGYTFNLATIKNSIDSASNNITVLSDAIDNIDGATNNLQELVRNLENKTAYIQMKTDSDGNPCIELGKDDNPFKVRITNKTIDFLNGSSTVAYFNNKSLYIETAVIKNELEIGEGSGFSWKKRPNGNMGLQWIGGIN